MAVQAKTKKIYDDIRTLRIQGADEAAAAALEALRIEGLASKARNRKDFFSDLRASALYLKTVRPTEPELRNALRLVFTAVHKSPSDDVAELKHGLDKQVEKYEENLKKVRGKIAEYGARLVPDGGTVLVHCHSGSVVAVLKKAFDEEIDFKVFACETRPLYQGRKTARQLSEYGIPTTLVVDSAARLVLTRFMRDSDVVLVGADAITSEGDLVNKIGTSQVALSAFEHEKHVYSCAGTHKFDPLTLWGSGEPIEERDSSEVAVSGDFKLKKFPKALHVFNPAFDVTEAKYVNAFVTELGVLPPQSLVMAVWKELGLSEKQLI
ncbi:S-methyl-5-thioribose-1-phosphate isomerase [Candidatus Micrarchaeota archaeon]|nr:S-methyl-5-thioribose-1-phosphate isomerase [Candidatus Micrarchaeota archaeon]